MYIYKNDDKSKEKEKKWRKFSAKWKKIILFRSWRTELIFSSIDNDDIRDDKQRTALHRTGIHRSSFVCMQRPIDLCCMQSDKHSWSQN